MEVSVLLTIFFEDPFYIGIVEKRVNHQLSVSRIVFGKEPKDIEIYHFVLTRFDRLSFSEATTVDPITKRNTFKKKLKESRKAMHQSIGTKSQQAIKKMYEEKKIIKKKKSHQERIEESKRQYEIKKNKRLEKHKGH